MARNLYFPMLVSSLILVLGGLTFAKSKDGDGAEHKPNYYRQDEWSVVAGRSQSPVDIQEERSERIKDAGSIYLSYQNAVLDDLDIGSGVKVGGSGFATINGRKFDFRQFHFHTRSEHSIDGNYYPVEVHFVNQAQDGRLAVIAAFLDKGQANPALQAILNHLKSPKDNRQENIVDVYKLLPENLSYYHYNGSLTTPPLSENVEWYVMKQPVELSVKQIDEFAKYNGSNSRKAQPLNGRVVLQYDD